MPHRQATQDLSVQKPTTITGQPRCSEPQHSEPQHRELQHSEVQQGPGVLLEFFFWGGGRCGPFPKTLTLMTKSAIFPTLFINLTKNSIPCLGTVHYGGA